MRKITLVCCLLFFTLFFRSRAFAQDTGNTQQATKAQDAAKAPAQPVHYYHLEFTIEQISPEGKPAPYPSSYTASISTGSGPMSIRSDSKVPIVAGSWLADGKENQSFQYQDVGVHIDAYDPHEIGSQLTFNLIAELTTLAAPTNPDIHRFVIRQNKWQAWVLIPIGKPTTIFTSDDLYNKGGVQVVVTATPLQ